MRILSLRASFGRLNNEQLDLTDGLNVLTLPNESGKSTWSQFILCMFYGIDTSERAKSNALPVKTKYKPWSGAPMQGSMDLEWNGRRITIERTSTGRGLMNNFRAYETESGLPIPELTAENCGRVLLGVERSVFERSAFIRQAGLAVTQDGALEQRLQALVTTGDEGTSYIEAERTLRERRNYLGRPHTGQLDRLQAELEQVRSKRLELERLGQTVFSLAQEQQRLTEQQQTLEQQLTLAQAQEAAAKLQQLRAAETLVAEKERVHAAALEAAAKLPDEQTLAELEQRLDNLPPPPGQKPPHPTPPMLPQSLQGLDAQQIRHQTEIDLAAFDAAGEVKKQPWWLSIMAGLLSVAGIITLFFNLPLGLGLVCFGQFFLQLSLHQRRKAVAQNAQQEEIRQAILAKYDAADRAAIVQLSERCCAELALYERLLTQYDETLAAHDEARHAYDEAVTALLAALRTFSNAADLSEARPALRAARAKHETLHRAKVELTQVSQNYVNLKSALGELSAPDPALLNDPAVRAPVELERELAALQMRLQTLRSQLDQNQGQRSAIGDPAALAAREEELLEQCDSLRLHVAALDDAIRALNAANDELQTRISPAMAQKAGEYMAFLTDGRYDKVQLAADFSAFARPAGESVHRSLSYLSAGTADQLYLSVRLAICALALEEDYGAPLILDDALVSFDDVRCGKALELLKELSEQRQILLFTCQSREAALLNA